MCECPSQALLSSYPPLPYTVWIASYSSTSSSRHRSEEVLNALAGIMPEIVGGSADLTGSNLTNLKVIERDSWPACVCL